MLMLLGVSIAAWLRHRTILVDAAMPPSGHLRACKIRIDEATRTALSRVSVVHLDKQIDRKPREGGGGQRTAVDREEALSRATTICLRKPSRFHHSRSPIGDRIDLLKVRLDHFASPQLADSHYRTDRNAMASTTNHPTMTKEATAPAVILAFSFVV
jgi:hypothetical protein